MRVASEVESVSSVTAKEEVSVFVQGDDAIYLRVKYKDFQVKLWWRLCMHDMIWEAFSLTLKKEVQVRISSSPSQLIKGP